jgi:hypothetical protein
VPKRTAWDDRYYVRAYEYARAGLSENKVLRALGLPRAALRRKPALGDAICRGASRGKEFDLKEYVYGRLPPELQRVWDRYERLRDEGKEDTAKARLLFGRRGERARQYLYLHALMTSHFNSTEARRVVGVEPTEWQRWDGDPLFRQLAANILIVKKDYAEGGLFAGIARGDTAAAVFVNSTLNRDRGYDRKITVKHEGRLDHLHAQVDFDAVLKLVSVEAQTEILSAVRRLRDAPRPALPPKEV